MLTTTPTGKDHCLLQGDMLSLLKVWHHAAGEEGWQVSGSWTFLPLKGLPGDQE
jgi:hypothetical protein